MANKIWITWENQRRSLELAKELGCDLYVYEYKGILKYMLVIPKTIFTIFKTKPKIIFVQNPSMILATLVCLVKILFNVPVVVDRHTTFLLTRKYRNTPSIILFKLLHRFTIKYATLTIVTNRYLADIVRDLKGSAFVLPDKIPDITCDNENKLKGNTNNSNLRGKICILLVSSFGIDEPIVECIEAMRQIEKDYVMYITGNYKKLDSKIVDSAPENVVFTGFVPIERYEQMLCSVDIVMALTTADFCMLCGCYEAVSVEKPLITSNKKVLIDYFSSVKFTDNTTIGITQSIREVVEKLDSEKKKVIELKQQLSESWVKDYETLKTKLDNMIGA